MPCSHDTQTNVLKQSLQALSSAIRSHKTPSKPQAITNAINAFQSHILSADLTHINLASLPSDQTNEAIHHIWQQLAETLSRLPPALVDHSTTLLASAADALTVTNAILQHAYPTPLPRIAAANTAAAQLTFCTIRLKLSLPNLSAPLQTRLDTAITRATAFLHQMRHTTSDTALIARLYPQIHPFLQAAIKSEQDLSPSSTLLALHHLAPSEQVLSAITAAVHPTTYFPRAAPLLLSVIIPQLEDVNQQRRTLSIRTVTTLIPALTRENLLKPHLEPLITALTSACLWQDPRSTTAAIPLLHDLLCILHPPSPLTVQPPHVWTTAETRLRSTTSHHAMHTAEDADSHAMAAMQLARYVPSLSRERLITHAEEWLDVLSALLPRAAALRRQDEVCDDEFGTMVDAVVESIRWTWPRASRYLTKVYTGCLAAFLEHSVDVVATGVSRIICALADCDARRVLQLIKCARREAGGYGSLTRVDGFLKGVETQVEKRLGTEEGTAFAGTLVGKFFGREIGGK